MLNAVFFLPCHIRLLTNRVTNLSLYFASGARGNFLACVFLIVLSEFLSCLFFSCGFSSGLFLLRTILAAALLPVLYTRRIQTAPDDMITYTGKVLYTTTADQHDRVLLQIVPLTRDISDHLHFVRQTNLRHLTESG